MTLHQKPLIVAFGLGEMGTVHAHNLARQRSIRLGIACQRPALLAAKAAELHADAQYSSYEAALEDPEVSAVVISTKPDTHVALIIAAARAGKHIFSEKPIGTTRESILEAKEAVEKAGVRFMVGFMRRWDPGYSAARARFATGDLGHVSAIKSSSGDKDYPAPYLRGGPKNSMFNDLAVHDIDIAHWFSASRVKRVFATSAALSYPQLAERGDCDVAAIILDMESGAKAICHLSRALAHGYCAQTEIVAQKGSLRIGQFGDGHVKEVSDGFESRRNDCDYRERFAQAFDREMEAFAKLIVADDDEYNRLIKEDNSYAGMEDGLAATCVSEAMIKSVTSGQAVEVVYA